MLTTCIVIIAIVTLIKWFLAPSEFSLLPTRQEYLQQHPDCHTDKGMKCKICNANSIKNMGWGESNSRYRVFVCNHCGEHLYRSDTLFRESKSPQKDRGEDDPWLK